MRTVIEAYMKRRRLRVWSAPESRGKKRVAKEYSPGDAVPYLDRIPAGVLEMVRATGAEVVSSGELVSRFYAGGGNSMRGYNNRRLSPFLLVPPDTRNDRATDAVITPVGRTTGEVVRYQLRYEPKEGQLLDAVVMDCDGGVADDLM